MGVNRIPSLLLSPTLVFALALGHMNNYWFLGCGPHADVALMETSLWVKKVGIVSHQNSGNEHKKKSVGSEKTALSGPLNERGARMSASATSFGGGIRSSTSTSRNLKSRDEAYVEITLNDCDDSVAVHSAKTVAGDVLEVPELTLQAKDFEKRSSFRSSKQALPSRFNRTKSAAAHALKGLKFTRNTNSGAGWDIVEKRFDKLTAGTMSGQLPRSLFGECIGMKESKEFACMLFDALARKRNIYNDSINKAQLKEFWGQISDQNFDSRLQTLFDIVDVDADGRITEDEVRELICLSASANKLSNIQTHADEFAALIMEELDPDRHGYITIQNLGMLLLQAQNQSRRGEMPSQKLKPTQGHNPLRRWYQNPYFLQDNWQRVWVIALWVGVMFGLFAYKFAQYRNKAAYEVMGHCVCMAKGAAETLKLNMALILLPVCRNTITWLRNKTRLGIIVPFDDNLNFHKVIAMGILIGVVVHALYHLACDFPRLIHASSDMYELMKPYFGEQPSNYWHFIKGVEGVTGIVMVVLMAIAFTLATRQFRRNIFNLPKPLKKVTGFNAFWYSHHLFIIVYTLLIVHGVCLYMTKEWYKKTTWMYLAVPLILFACERLIRAFRSSIEPVKILKVVIYPGNVLALHMSKPQGFKCKSGQYMFVNCATISPFEWHPFHITSAPADDYLSVHIRTLGDWTCQLKTVFAEVCQPPVSGKSGLLRAILEEENNPSIPRVLIDGPYGAPSQDYKKYEVVLLVGLGIGAAPMISILKDIVNNIKVMEEEENALENGNGIASNYNNNSFRTRRAYFYWVTREQGSFEWFKGLMNEVGELDSKGVIEMHNYCTSVYEEGDIRSSLIAMLQTLNHAKNGLDVVSGTRVKSHFDRPNWRNVYKRIALNHSQTRVGVFYCGAPVLMKEIRRLALDFSHKTSTKFDFHKEHF